MPKHQPNRKPARRVDLIEEPKIRQSLEDDQIANEPVILASRHNFQPPLGVCKPQKQDPILQAARPLVAAESYKTVAGFCNPLGIAPVFSCNVHFVTDALNQGQCVGAMYAVGRYGLMAKVPLWMNGSNGQILVQIQDKNIDFKEWLDTLPAPTGSVIRRRRIRTSSTVVSRNRSAFPHQEFAG